MWVSPGSDASRTLASGSITNQEFAQRWQAQVYTRTLQGKTGEHLVELFSDGVPRGCQLRRHIGADADDGGGGAAWSPDSVERRPSVARTADEDDVVLVHSLQAATCLNG